MDIDVVRAEIGDEELGVHILIVSGDLDEETLRSEFTFTLYRQDDPAGEHRLTAIYDFARRDYAFKMAGVTGIDDLILCALQKLALYGAVHAAGCMKKAISAASPHGNKRRIASEFARCMGQAGTSFIAQAVAALVECASGAPGAGGGDNP